MNQFDETFFDFKVSGGATTSDIIQAEAVILKGRRSLFMVKVN